MAAAEKSEKPKRLKTAAQIAALAAEAEKETFPKGLAECFALQTKIRTETVSNEDEGEQRDARLLALSKHIHAIQQGLPLVHTKSSDFSHQHMHAVTAQMKLDRHIRTNPDVKVLATAKAALEKTLSDVLASIANAKDLAELQAAFAPKPAAAE